MQDEKLKDLLSNEYIEIADISHWNRMQFKHDHIDYVLHSKVENAITRGYTKELKDSLSYALQALKQSIIEKSKFIPPGNEYFKDLLITMLKNKAAILKGKIGDVEIYNNVDTLRLKWKRHLLLNVNSIHHFVFKQAKNDLDHFDSNTSVPDFEHSWFSNFCTKELNNTFTCVMIEEQIRYLRKQIFDLQNEKLFDIVSAGSDKKDTGRDNYPDEKSNALISNIESSLQEFKLKMSHSDYHTLIHALTEYFEKGCFPATGVLVVKGVNKKKFGWALNEIYRSLKPDDYLSHAIDYFLFAKNNISLFAKVDFDEKHVKSSKMYKYFTTKI